MDETVWVMPVLLIVAFFLVLFVVGPFIVRFKLKHSAEPQVIPFPLDQPSLPREIARDFQRVVEGLEPRGFEPVSGLALPRQTPEIKQIALLLANRKMREVAVAIVTFTEQADGQQQRVFCVEFGTRFRDGTVVITNNDSTLHCAAPRPQFIINQFSMVRDVNQLYRLHQMILARIGDGERTLRLDEEFGGDAVASITTGLIEQLEAQVQAGYAYLSPREKVYRPTCKGACLMVWKFVWPIGAIRRALRDRRAQRMFAELEAEADEQG